MKRLLIAIILVLLPMVLLAENFYIDGYDISLDIKEDGSAHIEEVMNIVFTSPSHGIYRDIQYKFNNPQNIWKNIEAKITNVRCNIPFSVEKSDSFISLKIGNSDSYFTGSTLVMISYDYDLGGDIYTEYDEFYYNFISAAWNCPIYNISCRATFPKSLDKDRVWITTGSYGSDTTMPFHISQNGKEISIDSKGIYPYQAITLRAEMDEGYFSRQNTIDKSKVYISIISASIISVLFTLYVFFSYRKYGVDNELTPPITFYPPKDYNPMDVGYVYDGKLTGEKEITAMLFYWADKGYLKIEEIEENNFKFIKLKDISSEECEAERMLFILLFQSGNEVTFDTLDQKEFYLQAPQKVFAAVKKQFTGKCSLLDKKANTMKGINSVLLFITTMISAFIASSVAIGTLTLVLLGIGFLFTALSLVFASKIIGKWHLNNTFKRTISFIPIVITSAIYTFILAGLLSTLTTLSLALIASIIIAISLLVTTIAITATEKRSEYGERKLEEILGYKDFIERVEIDKLKLLIDEDPEIFYHTLSFAMVFDLEDTWIKKFKNLYIPKCSWYYSPAYSMMDAMFYSSMIRRSRHQYSHMQHIAISNSRPTSGGGGFRTFSGSSGFSGGGFSGGGGRSW